MTISFIAGAIVVPLFCYCVNLFFRYLTEHGFQNSGADFILLLIVFDINAIIDSLPVKALIKNQIIAKDINGVFIISIVFECLIWWVCVWFIEPYIRFANIKSRVNTRYILSYAGAWSLASTAFGAHVYIFH